LWLLFSHDIRFSLNEIILILYLFFLLELHEPKFARRLNDDSHSIREASAVPKAS
jgi:hypothetical protein